VSHTTSSFKEIKQPRKATLAGLVSSLKRRRTRKGDLMAVFNLEDLEGSVEVVVFPETYGTHRSLIDDDAALLIAGSVEISEDQRRLIAESLLPLEQAEERKAREVVIALTSIDLEVGAVERVRDLLRERPGPCPVFLEVTRHPSYRATLKAGSALKVSPSRELALAVEGILGKGSVRFR